MIEIRRIDRAHRQDVNIPNQPFSLFGRLTVRHDESGWSWSSERFAQETQMCFPDENYDYDEMAKTCVFLGAYEGDACVALAILQSAMFRYLYLYDLKVDAAYRGRGVARALIDAAKAVAAERGLRGLYTIGQDNNLGACLFYLHSGFRIGGLDTEVYRGTKQEGKADVLFYLDI